MNRMKKLFCVLMVAALGVLADWVQLSFDFAD